LAADAEDPKLFTREKYRPLAEQPVEQNDGSAWSCTHSGSKCKRGRRKKLSGGEEWKERMDGLSDIRKRHPGGARKQEIFRKKGEKVIARMMNPQKRRKSHQGFR